MKQYPRDFNQDHGVWIHKRPPKATTSTATSRASRSGSTGVPADQEFDYSDGSNVEKRLLDILARARNLSSDSSELDAAITDWPSRYHLSSERANLLRALDLKSHAHVLELGAGCGAVTRWLGEHTRQVTAVEGSATRARIAAQRCRDLSNVDIVASRFDEIRFRNQFDLVTLIGVLEYAALYARGDGNPFVQTLRFVHESMRPDGVLLLAIENKLGIKYLAGSSEDHMGQAFIGLEGYPDPLGPRTFGRMELTELLRRCGFEDVQFLLPFPDYKIPTSVLNGDRTSARMARTCNLVDWCRQPYLDYSRGTSQKTLFNAHLALRSFAENGLLADVSNSFLVLVSKTALGKHSVIPRANWIARKINSARRPAYRSLVTLEESQGRTVIHKEIIASTAVRRKRKKQSTATVSHHLTASAPFIEGSVSMTFLMLQALHRTEERQEEFRRLLQNWVCFLANAAADPQQPTVLPTRYVDCIPANLLVDAAGTMHYIDDEWGWHEPVQLEWVILRGLLQFWRENRSSILGRIVDVDAEFDDFVDCCMEMAGLKLRANHLQRYQKQESRMQDLVLTIGAQADASPSTESTPEQ